MTDHARTQLRNAIIALLNNKTMAKERVLSSHVYALDSNTLPVLLISTRYEKNTPITLSYPRTIARELDVIIEGYVKMHGDINHTLDTLTLQIEEALITDTSLELLVKELQLESTEITLSNEGDKPIGMLTMKYLVRYQTKEHLPNQLH